MTSDPNNIGSFPPAQLLKEYAEVMPDAPERLMAQWEAEAQHRRKLAEAASKRSIYGLACGFIAAMSGLGVSCVLGLNGHDAVAGTIAAIDLVGLVSVFIYGANTKAKLQASEDTSPRALPQESG